MASFDTDEQSCEKCCPPGLRAGKYPQGNAVNRFLCQKVVTLVLELQRPIFDISGTQHINNPSSPSTLNVQDTVGAAPFINEAHSPSYSRATLRILMGGETGLLGLSPRHDREEELGVDPSDYGVDFKAGVCNV